MNDEAEVLNTGQEDGNVAAAVAVQPYVSPSGRAMAVCVLLILGILLHAIQLWLNADELELLSRLHQGEVAAEQEIDANYAKQNTLVYVFNGESLVLAVAFLMWVHRTHRNLPALRATGLEFTPGWSVGWFFIPLANLFKPYQVMREICNASDPAEAPGGSATWRAYPAPIVVKLWWVTFLVMGFANGVLRRAGPQAEVLADFQIVAVASIVVSCLAIVASLVALWLVRSVTRRQEKRAEIIGLSQ